MAKDKLSLRQKRAVPKIIASATIKEGCSSAKIDQSTYHKWMRQDPFRAAIEAARSEALQEAIGMLKVSTTSAVAVLRECVDSTVAVASQRITAARAILDLTLKAVESEEVQQIKDRISKLEAEDGNTD